MRTEGVHTNLVNGVSRQPFAVRLPSQVQEQINAYSTISKGLRKRPPSRYISRIPNQPASARTHFIDRDDNERYVVFGTDSGLKVFDLQTGAEKTVTAPNGFDYLDCDDPAEDLDFLTVIDTTWVLNKSKTVATLTDTTPTRPKEALIFVVQANYSQEYEILVNGTRVARCVTPRGEHTGTNEQVTAQILTQTEKIAGTLVQGTGFSTPTNTNTGTVYGMNYNNGATWAWMEQTLTAPEWTITRYENVIHLVNNLGNDFTIDVISKSDDHLRVFKDEINDFNKLPTRGPTGYVVSVSGNEDTEWDNYWVRFEQTPDLTTGIWKECAAPGTLTSMDPTTLPHRLVRNTDGTFTFDRIEWGEREVGNLELSAWPGFVSRKIGGMTFWKNRFGLYAGEFITLSEAGSYYNFFRTTVLQVLDSDPIDVQITYPDLSEIQALVPFNENLIAFTDTVQFRMQGDELVTPRTANFRAVTDFYSNGAAKPVTAGTSLFFLTSPDFGDGAKIREFVFDIDFGFREGSEVTDHVEGYVPSDVYRLSASKISKCMAVLARSEPNTVFIYKYYWRNKDSKIQSAWSRWDFDMEVVSATIVRDDLYLLLRQGDDILVENVPLAEGFADYGDRLTFHLDHRMKFDDLTAVYDAQTNCTTFTLPATIPGTKVVITEDGLNIPVVSQTDTSVVVSGEQTGPLFIGVPFNSYVLLSRLVAKRQVGDDATPINANLVINNYAIHLSDTAYVKMKVWDRFRDTYEREFTGYADDPARKVGVVPVLTETVSVSVDANVDDCEISFESDSYLPFGIIATHWTGNLGPRT